MTATLQQPPVTTISNRMIAALVALAAAATLAVWFATADGVDLRPASQVSVVDPALGPNADLAPTWSVGSAQQLGPNADLAPVWSADAPVVLGPNADLAPAWAD